MNYYYTNAELDEVKRINNGIDDGSIMLLDPPKPNGEPSELIVSILREMSHGQRN